VARKYWHQGQEADRSPPRRPRGWVSETQHHANAASLTARVLGRLAFLPLSIGGLVAGGAACVGDAQQAGRAACWRGCAQALPEEAEEQQPLACLRRCGRNAASRCCARCSSRRHVVTDMRGGSLACIAAANEH
jgi:hypothetical protein